VGWTRGRKRLVWQFLISLRRLAQEKAIQEIASYNIASFSKKKGLHSAREVRFDTQSNLPLKQALSAIAKCSSSTCSGMSAVRRSK
jgi:hypothetical protein